METKRPDRVLSRQARISEEDGHWLVLIPERRAVLSYQGDRWDTCVSDEDGDPIAHPTFVMESFEGSLEWVARQPEVASSRLAQLIKENAEVKAKVLELSRALEWLAGETNVETGGWEPWEDAKWGPTILEAAELVASVDGEG